MLKQCQFRAHLGMVSNSFYHISGDSGDDCFREKNLRCSWFCQVHFLEFEHSISAPKTKKRWCTSVMGSESIAHTIWIVWNDLAVSLEWLGLAQLWEHCLISAWSRHATKSQLLPNHKSLQLKSMIGTYSSGAHRSFLAETCALSFNFELQ